MIQIAVNIKCIGILMLSLRTLIVIIFPGFQPGLRIFILVHVSLVKT